MRETVTSRERVTARIPAQIRETLEAAAAMTGATLNQFMVAAAIQEAKRIIDDEYVIRLNAEDSAKFISALDKPFTPNTKLQELLSHYRKIHNAESGAIDWEPPAKTL